MADRAEAIRAQISALVAEYHEAAFATRAFVPGESPVPVAGRVFGASDMQHLVDAGLDFWLTTGRFAAQFERRFARVMGVRHAMLCNSGSSANLVALSVFHADGDQRLRLRSPAACASCLLPASLRRPPDWSV